MSARKKTLDQLQTAYRLADRTVDERREEADTLGTSIAFQRLASAQRRRWLAVAAVYAWLDINSPRGSEWRVGVSSHWVCAYLTEEDALSETPDSLPPPQRRRKAGL